MLSWNTVVAVSLIYVATLFAVAFWAEDRARKKAFGWLRSPLAYTLSISVYCTAWTFYGAVGSASREGLNFATIYLGPTIVFVGWWWILRKLVRIAREHRTTSIADLISSRYGKSTSLGVAVTLLAVVSSTPYIALQLKSLTVSFALFAPDNLVESGEAELVTGFWIAAGLAFFTILFGTRNVDANERHYGVVTAIALEAIVKLVALVSVGLFVVYGVADGPADLFSRASPEILHPENLFGPRWVTLIFLSAAAVICLPRMFQVTVVENVDERHLATASWAFPLYLFLICLFVLPVAVAGQMVMPDGAEPDLYVLTVPLSQGQNGLALLAFLGGFSSATSMVIVAAIALSTMVSNHIVMPIWLEVMGDRPQSAGDVRRVLLTSRRLTIGGILALGYVYYRLTGGTGGLASIGLIAFLGVAQLLPGLIGGIYWRGATRLGAIAGLFSGFCVWAYTLLMPSFGPDVVLSAQTLSQGPWGIEALRPESLFGLEIEDNLVHAVFWSISVNTLFFISFSLLSSPDALERLQSKLFVDVFVASPDGQGMILQRSAASEDLYALAQRILGPKKAHSLFRSIADRQGLSAGLPQPTAELTQRLERELTGTIGAASAHAMVSQIAGGGTVSVDDLIRMADETAQIVEYSQRLELKSLELEETAAELRRANGQLQLISDQKDAFLSQVSHELRTPMTSVRSFAEILREDSDLPPEQSQRFLSIIHDESLRLTRLLDEILDLSVLESGHAELDRSPTQVQPILRATLNAVDSLVRANKVKIVSRMTDCPKVQGDPDRLSQVMINLISNAIKYGAKRDAQIEMRYSLDETRVFIDIVDNGPGIPEAHSRHIFEKFARLGKSTLAGGAGLGLPISREIMRNLGGELELLPTEKGATFRVTLLRA